MSNSKSIKEFEESLLLTPVREWITKQVIVFDWFDGPREGVCSLDQPEVSFYFELIDERALSDDLDDRLFSLRQIPYNSVEEISSAIGELGTPTGRVWVPVWKFQNPLNQDRAEEIINRIFLESSKTNLVVYTRDMIGFLGCWRVDQTVKIKDWFTHLGIN